MRSTRRLSGSGGIAEAARLLREGGLVAFPTETVYGLGALALDPLAVRGIYAAKGRPATNPLIVHVSDIPAARELVSSWTPLAQRLAEQFWPGPLTLVLPRTDRVPDEVTAGGATVAVRAPAHPIARELLAAAGAPLAAPSANRAEHVSPTTAAHVLADLDGRIDAVLDGGASDLGIESTVLSLAHRAPRLLRTGSVSRPQLEAICGPIEIGAAGDTVAPSPGMQRRHYAPASTVRLVEPARVSSVTRQLEQMVRTGVLLRISEPPGGDIEEVRLAPDAAGYARGLYAALRDLESRGCTAIVIEHVPEGSEWDAIRDRLSRAAG